MEYRGKMGNGGGHDLPPFDNNAAPGGRRERLAGFLEALAHHSAVCRKLQPAGANPAAGHRGNETG